MRIRPIPLCLRRLALPEQSRSRYARKLGKQDAYEMLKEMTEQVFGYDVAQWRAWINKNMTLDGQFKDRKTRI